MVAADIEPAHIATVPDTAAHKLESDSTSASYSDKCLGDDGVRSLCSRLATTSSLTSLNLRGCHIHAPGAAAVGELLLHGRSKLRVLSLEWNGIGTDDAGPRSLAVALQAAHSALTSLDLRNNRIGPRGVKHLAEALVHNVTLVSLDLRWNSAAKEGGEALESALRANRKIMHLPLEGNRVPGGVLQRITTLLGRNGADATETTNYLTLTGCSDQALGADPVAGGRRLAVRTRALEGALTLQQSEFTNKLSHVQGRIEDAEARANEEAARAEGLVAQLEAAKTSVAKHDAEAASAARALEEEKRAAAAEVEAAQRAMRHAEKEKLCVEAALAAAERAIEAKDAAMLSETRALGEREARAAAAEERAAAAHAELAKAQEARAAERREHAEMLAALQQRVASAETTAANSRVASSEAQAAALERQASTHTEALEALAAERRRMEARVARAEIERDEALDAAQRARDQAEARRAQAEEETRERERRAASVPQARANALSKRLEDEAAAQATDLERMRVKLSQSEETAAAAMAEAEGRRVELARAQARAEAEAAARKAVEADAERARAVAEKEMSATRDALSETRADRQSLSQELLEARQALVASQARFDASLQGLSARVQTVFFEAASGTCAVPPQQPTTSTRSLATGVHTPEPVTPSSTYLSLASTRPTLSGHALGQDSARSFASEGTGTDPHVDHPPPSHSAALVEKLAGPAGRRAHCAPPAPPTLTPQPFPSIGPSGGTVGAAEGAQRWRTVGDAAGGIGSASSPSGTAKQEERAGTAAY